MQQARLDYEELPIGGIQAEHHPLHGWFSYWFSHKWWHLDHIFSQMDWRRDCHVHDPFCGAATTIVEAARRRLSHEHLRDQSIPSACSARIFRQDGHAGRRQRSVEKNSSGNEFSRNRVPSVRPDALRKGACEQFWREDVLCDLLRLKSAIARTCDDHYREFFTVSLAAVLIPQLTNVQAERLGLVHRERSGSIDVLTAFSSKASAMIDDLNWIERHPFQHQPILMGADATLRSSYDSLPAIDIVVTSPPYPNGLSYISHTFPYLVLFELGLNSEAVPNFKDKIIGGARGLRKMRKYRRSTRETNSARVFAPCAIALRRASQRPRTTQRGYFGMMARHLVALNTRLADSCSVAYIVANDRIAGELVETDVLLADLMQRNCGLKAAGFTAFAIGLRVKASTNRSSMLLADAGGGLFRHLAPL